jgi:branched-chain amino acid transport system ATP-binding protein
VTDHALELDGVSRRFGALTALQPVSLAVRAGERRAILGANGAGKTTLFNLIAGDLQPSTGRVRLFGQDVTRLPTHRRIRLGMRRTYQTSLVFGGLTVRECLFLAVRGVRGARFAINRPASRCAEMAEVERLAAGVGIGEALEARAGELSHGEARQLELGMASAGEPRLLLLDEPAAGLSLAERRRLLALLRALPRSLTLVLIEHDMDVALQAVDRVTVLHNGRQVADGTPDEIASDAQVHAIYMGSPIYGSRGGAHAA